MRVHRVVGPTRVCSDFEDDAAEHSHSESFASDSGSESELDALQLAHDDADDGDLYADDLRPLDIDKARGSASQLALRKTARCVTGGVVSSFLLAHPSPHACQAQSNVATAADSVAATPPAPLARALAALSPRESQTVGCPSLRLLFTHPQMTSFFAGLQRGAVEQQQQQRQQLPPTKRRLVDLNVVVQALAAVGVDARAFQRQLDQSSRQRLDARKKCRRSTRIGCGKRAPAHWICTCCDRRRRGTSRATWRRSAAACAAWWTAWWRRATTLCCRRGCWSHANR